VAVAGRLSVRAKWGFFRRTIRVHLHVRQRGRERAVHFNNRILMEEDPHQVPKGSSSLLPTGRARHISTCVMNTAGVSGYAESSGSRHTAPGPARAQHSRQDFHLMSSCIARRRVHLREETGFDRKPWKAGVLARIKPRFPHEGAFSQRPSSTTSSAGLRHARRRPSVSGSSRWACRPTRRTARRRQLWAEALLIMRTCQ